MALRSLRSLTLAFLCLFVIVTALSGFALFTTSRDAIRRLVDERINSESTTLAPVGRKARRAELVKRIQELTSHRDTGDLGFVLTDSRGRKIAGNIDLLRQPPLGFSWVDEHDRIAGLTVGRALARALGEGLTLVVIAETEPIDNYNSARVRLYLIGFGAIIIVVLGGLLLFRRLIGQRIIEMMRTADAIVDGDMQQRVSTIGDDGEFDQQAKSFNRMLDRIGELMSQIRNVSNDISHELRTPLARLRNQLALLEQREAAGPVREELSDAIAQADDLLAMFSAMLRISEIESGSRRRAFAALSLGDLVHEVAELMEPIAAEAGRALQVGRCDPAPGVGDRQLLTQMLMNLIENGLRHTPVGSRIDLSVEEHEASIRLIISDNGPGIPAEQRALVMRRFGRLDKSRSTAGHGLGLPLIQAIVRLHHGTMALDDAMPGLRITLSFPR